MHSYSINSRERYTVIVGLAFLSFVLAGIVNTILASLNFTTLLTLFIGSISPFGMWGILFWSFNKHLWRWNMFRFLGLVNVPDLNGCWNGQIQSSYDNFRNYYEIKVHIHQTWSEIQIRLETSTSNSTSESTSLFVSKTGIPKVIYHFRNVSNFDNVKTMSAHEGTVKLELQDKNSLKGNYYTDRERDGNFGRIELIRDPNNNN